MKLIAEIGLNHLGSDASAISLVKRCLKTEIDGITLQLQPENYYNNTRNFRKKLKTETYKEISTIIQKKRKMFGLALMNEDTFSEFKDLKLDFIKILSTAFNNKNLIDIIYKRTKTFVSTGVANLREIQKLGNKYPKIDFIHTSLSNKIKDANLLAISTLKKELNNDVSFGHHSIKNEVMLGAVAHSPKNIFFYVKPNKKCYYPDNEHAIKINNLREIIDKIKLIKNSLGDGIKSKKKIPNWVFE